MTGPQPTASGDVEALASEIHRQECYSNCRLPTNADLRRARVVIESNWLAAYVQAARDEERARIVAEWRSKPGRNPNTIPVDWMLDALGGA